MTATILPFAPRPHRVDPGLRVVPLYAPGEIVTVTGANRERVGKVLHINRAGVMAQVEIREPHFHVIWVKLGRLRRLEDRPCDTDGAA